MSSKKLAAVALLLVLGFLACASPNVAEAPPVAHSADGTRIAYDLRGEGETTLLFVHGWSCDRTYWRHQIELFSPDFQVVVMDLAGHGESGADRTDYTIKAFGKDVEAVVDRIGARKVILVGHSMGGAVVAEAARLLSDRAIAVVGIDTLQNVSLTITAEQLDEMARPLEEDFVPGMRELVTSMFAATTDPDLAEWIRSDMALAPKAVALSSFRGYLGQFVTGEAARVFAEVRAPVYCLNTDAYPTDAEANRESMFSFEVMLMEEVGHFPMLEKPHEFNDALRSILDKIVGRQGAAPN